MTYKELKECMEILGKEIIIPELIETLETFDNKLTTYIIKYLIEENKLTKKNLQKTIFHCSEESEIRRAIYSVFTNNIYIHYRGGSSKFSGFSWIQITEKKNLKSKVIMDLYC
jgi:hypothetical protein